MPCVTVKEAGLNGYEGDPEIAQDSSPEGNHNNETSLAASLGATCFFRSLNAVLTK